MSEAPQAPVDEGTAYHIVESEGGTSLDIQKFSLWYGAARALTEVSLRVQKGLVTSLIGPSGCGKSTLLRSLNRMNDLIDGLRIAGVNNKAVLDETVERSLKGAALWDEVKDRLQHSALGLSGGQQQRLCIARAIAVNPEVILMDEPCSALDPKSTARVEDLIGELRENYTIIIVTHNMQQAARVSDFTAFLYEGLLIEYGATRNIFVKPKNKQTEDYITGRFG